jgi:hypothetical protein
MRLPHREHPHDEAWRLATASPETAGVLTVGELILEGPTTSDYRDPILTDAVMAQIMTEFDTTPAVPFATNLPVHLANSLEEVMSDLDSNTRYAIARAFLAYVKKLLADRDPSVAPAQPLPQASPPPAAPVSDDAEAAAKAQLERMAGRSGTRLS